MACTSKTVLGMRGDAGTFTFCATGKTGLGHLRRVTNIAAALKDLAPDAHLTLLTNAPVGGLSERESALFEDCAVLPREAMAGHLAGAEAGVVVVDTAAIPGIERLVNPLCLILRETIDTQLDRFALPGGRHWDRLIVPVPAGGWAPVPGVIPARSQHHVGWIFRTPDAAGTTRVLPAPAGAKLVLVAAGGGGSPETAAIIRDTADNLLAQLRDRCTAAMCIAQVAGPRFRPEDRLRQADTLVDVGAELPRAFAEADLVLSTVGYNSTLELAACDTPVLLLPILRSYDDQVARALWWQDRLGCAHRPDQMDRSLTFMVEVVESGRRRAPVALGKSGAQAAATQLLALAAGAVRGPDDEIVRKAVPSARIATIGKVLASSQQLFAAGAHTLPMRLDEPGEHVLARRIQGPTARQILASQGPAASRQDIERWESTLAQVLAAVIGFHRCPPGALGLAPYDPLARVRPRLLPKVLRSLERAGLASGPVVETVRRVAHELQRLPSRAAASGAIGVIHGDFHAGQLVFEFGMPVPWLIDLDDLALAPAEADLANFAAHFATTPELSVAPVEDAMTWLTDILGDLYEAKTGRAVSDRRLRIYGAAALLRRMFKLAQSGRPQPPARAIFDSVTAALRTHASPVDGALRRARADQSALELAAHSME